MSAVAASSCAGWSRRRTLALLGGAVAAGFVVQAQPSVAAPACRTIYLLRHEWHAGIVVDRRDVAAAYGLDAPDLLATDWLEFGWGDADFYQDADAGVLLGLKAIFMANESVMHVHGFDGAPERAFPQNEMMALRLSPDGYTRLLAYVRASFKRDAEGRARRLGPGLYGLSYFYEGEGTYHAFRTCNTWAAEALAAGGFPIGPSGIVTVGQLMDGLRGKAAEGCVEAG